MNTLTDLFTDHNIWALSLILIFGSISFYYIRKDVVETRFYKRKNKKSLEETYNKPLVFENRIEDYDKTYRVVKSEGNKVHIDIHNPEESPHYRFSLWRYHSFWFIKDTVPQKILDTENEWFAFIRP